LDSDHPDYGGHARLQPEQDHFTRPPFRGNGAEEALSLYLPNRTAFVLHHL